METHRKINTTICVKIYMQTQKDRSTEGQRISPRLRKIRQRCDELLNGEPRSDAFSEDRATTKPPPGSLTAGIDGFTAKIEPLSVSHQATTWTGGVLNSEYSWLVHYATPMLNDKSSIWAWARVSIYLSHYLHCVLFTRHDKQLLTIIRSPPAGIKSLLVSRSTTKNSGRNKPTNDLTNSSVERI